MSFVDGQDREASKQDQIYRAAEEATRNISRILAECSSRQEQMDYTSPGIVNAYYNSTAQIGDLNSQSHQEDGRDEINANSIGGTKEEEDDDIIILDPPIQPAQNSDLNNQLMSQQPTFNPPIEMAGHQNSLDYQIQMSFPLQQQNYQGTAPNAPLQTTAQNFTEFQMLDSSNYNYHQMFPSESDFQVSGANYSSSLDQHQSSFNLQFQSGFPGQQINGGPSSFEVSSPTSPETSSLSTPTPASSSYGHFNSLKWTKIPEVQRVIEKYADWSLHNCVFPGAFTVLFETVTSIINANGSRPISQQNLKKYVKRKTSLLKEKQQLTLAQQQAQMAAENGVNVNNLMVNSAQQDRSQEESGYENVVQNQIGESVGNTIYVGQDLFGPIQPTEGWAQQSDGLAEFLMMPNSVPFSDTSNTQEEENLIHTGQSTIPVEGMPILEIERYLEHNQCGNEPEPIADVVSEQQRLILERGPLPLGSGEREEEHCLFLQVGQQLTNTSANDLNTDIIGEGTQEIGTIIENEQSEYDISRTEVNREMAPEEGTQKQQNLDKTLQALARKVVPVGLGLHFATRSKPFAARNDSNPGMIVKYRRLCYPEPYVFFEKIVPINNKQLKMSDIGLMLEHVLLNEEKLSQNNMLITLITKEEEGKDQEEESVPSSSSRVVLKLEPELRSEFDDRCAAESTAATDFAAVEYNAENDQTDEEEEDQFVFRPGAILKYPTLPRMQIRIEMYATPRKTKRKQAGSTLVTKRIRKHSVNSMSKATAKVTKSVDTIMDGTANDVPAIQSAVGNRVADGSGNSAVHVSTVSKTAESASRRKRDNFEFTTMKEIFPRLAESLRWGLPKCTICDMEFSRSRYPIHMLKEHNVVTSDTKTIADLLRSIPRENWAAITWRCESCDVDVNSLKLYLEHCAGEIHKGRVGRYGKKSASSLANLATEF